jgi:prevent-host-death family protein
MEKVVGAFEARRSLGRLIEEAFYNRDSFIIERSGRPMAVLVSIDDYTRWQKLAKDRFFTMVETVRQRNASAPPQAIERDIKQALDKLRQAPRPTRKRKG